MWAVREGLRVLLGEAMIGDLIEGYVEVGP